MRIRTFFYGCILCMFCANSNAQTYVKNYFELGTIESEGWQEDNQKNGYWVFYYPNGKIYKQGAFKGDDKSEYWHYFSENGNPKMSGTYINGQKFNWWIFYNEKGLVNYKCQMNKDVKNGYCLKYTNEKLSSASKYENGKKINEWFSYSGFKSENKLSDLK